jgi:S1-C subfamily serine protease
MNKEKQNLVKSSEADEFFLSAKTISRPLPIKSSLALFFSTVLISLCAGFVAGLLQDSILPNATQVVSDAQDKKQDTKFDLSFLVNEDNNSNQTQQLLNNYVAGVYVKKATSAGLDGMYLPTDFLGTGMVVTSDGWILVPSGVVGDKSVVVVVNKKVYEPTKQIADSFNDSLLIKINASGLTPASYVKEDSINNYDAAFVVKYSQQNGIEAVKTSIKSINYSARTDLKSYIKNSDVIDHWLMLNTQLPENYKGALVINQSGLVVGQVNSKATAVVPQYYVASTVNQFLDKSQIVVRPSFGVYYLQLDEAIGLVDKITEGQTMGALVTSDGLKIDAVKKDSAAAKAGLLAGDVITKVNDQEIDSNNSLTKLIQEYKPGSKINLAVIRSGEKKSLEVVLE